jgi:hypothetical protein
VVAHSCDRNVGQREPDDSFAIIWNVDEYALAAVVVESETAAGDSPRPEPGRPYLAGSARQPSINVAQCVA